MLEIRWHSRGGQGAKTVSQVLAVAALKIGKFVQSFPEYGPERGGAPMKVYNRIDEAEIKVHAGVYQPDIVVVIDNTLLNSQDVGVTDGLKADGLLLVNTLQTPEQVREVTGYVGRIWTVDADRIAEETGNRFPNVPVLGALVRALESVPLTSVEEAMQEMLTGKLSDQAVIVNLEALRQGYDWINGNSETEVTVRRDGHEQQPSTSTSTGRRTATLMSYREMPTAGVVLGFSEDRPKTGAWRTGEKPIYDERTCINCLLCWINCPEPAVIIESEMMQGFDYDSCKGCGICFEVCPVESISMVPEAEQVPPQGRMTSSVSG
ncbi:MAG: 2-oxoacid:acceptor oxidoreductase family protein [Candidatus Bipolaricaulia bacterium]